MPILKHLPSAIKRENKHYMFPLIGLFILAYSALTLNYVFAADMQLKQDQSSLEINWCREVAELGKKYDATRRLPDSYAMENKACQKDELAECLLEVIEKVVYKCAKEGSDAVPREDLERIGRLHEALKDKLSELRGYQGRREEIEKLLAAPEQPPFLFKYGVKGFLRWEGAGNFRLSEFAFNPGHSESRFLYRLMPYVFWHPTDFIDIHLEGQGYGFSGGSQYQGKYSLYQGFIEAKLPDSDVLALKIGRQDFVYGSAFILGSDSFFNGLSFDAVRLRIKPFESMTIDLLAGWYATPWSDGFKGNMVGGYASYSLAEGTVIEAYAFDDTGSLEHHIGEHLDIWGLRGTVRVGPLTFEIEPVYESGRTLNSDTGSNERISAWGGHGDVSLEAEFFKRKNTFFAGYAYGSGNKDSATGLSSRREFRNHNTDTTLTGDMSLVGDLSGVNAGETHASGLQIFNLGWGIELTKALSFSTAVRYFYANGVPEGFSRRIGLETDFSLTYAINDMLTVLVGYDRFFSGRFFRDASGSDGDVNYGYLMVQFDLSRAKPKKM